MTHVANRHIFRISRGDLVADVRDPEAIEAACKDLGAGHYTIDALSANQVGGFTSRRWGGAVCEPDGSVSVEREGR